jgi:hypothetical protein
MLWCVTYEAARYTELLNAQEINEVIVRGPLFSYGATALVGPRPPHC